MRDPFQRVDRRLLARIGILLAIVLFVALNILAGQSLTRTSFDLTEDRRFTLSPAMVELVENLDEPIHLRLFLSRLLTDINPAYAAHADRVKALLQRLEQLSDGKLQLEIYDPEPFSPEEDLAVANGMQAFSLGDQSGDLVYFGLAGSNSTDDHDTVGFFSLDRAPFLEYDLARLIADLSEPEKQKIALLGSAPLSGDQSSGFQPQVVYTLLQEFYDVTAADAADGEIDDDIKVLILAQPDQLSPAELYAVDQYLLSGRPVLAFVDPYSEHTATIAQQQYQQPAMSDLSAIAPLFAKWGFAVPQGEVAADRRSARRVVATSQGRQVVTDYVIWLSLPKNRFAKSEALLSQLSVLNLNSAGVIEPVEDAGTTLEPLVSTTPEGTRIAVDAIAVDPDPVALLAAYQAEGILTLAARVSGEADSLYGNAPPEVLHDSEGVDFEALSRSHLSHSGAPGQIILLADSDFLYDHTWLTADQSGVGQAVPIANNADFVLNAVEQLIGRGGLASLRGRGLIDRPFEVIEDMSREAELKYRQREADLISRIHDAEKKLGELESGSDGNIVLTPEQEAAVEALRVELVEARRELREVQRNLRDELESLVNKLQLVNIAAVPVLVALIGLGVSLVRRRRATGSAARD